MNYENDRFAGRTVSRDLKSVSFEGGRTVSPFEDEGSLPPIPGVFTVWPSFDTLQKHTQVAQRRSVRSVRYRFLPCRPWITAFWLLRYTSAQQRLHGYDNIERVENGFVRTMPSPSVKLLTKERVYSIPERPPVAQTLAMTCTKAVIERCPLLSTFRSIFYKVERTLSVGSSRGYFTPKIL